MPRSIRGRLLTYFIIPSGLAVYCTHLGLSHLEKKYPNQPLTTGSKALQTPSKPNIQYCPYTDIYAARIPLRSLIARRRNQNDPAPSKTDLEDAWARTVFGSRIMKTESSIVGLITNGKYQPGDTGDTPERFAPNKMTGQPRELVNGLMSVQREIGADDDSNGLLLSWKMANEPRVFFERIARWGYPWRLMSGGRHEMSVSEPYRVDSESELFLDVRFSAAHDYEVVPEEGDLEIQKILPEWTNRLHWGYARLILDLAVRELQVDLK
ncbi:uncharacterized protein N7483_007629 [Penicillium malachiteum]|uniref:uncharacterized protein n=1 Tax=Penicillium malachiteum TaxID=1324776 RepID=UPI002546F9BE|nr:uncharacterized protein N7483_007629 [Penicillium malachiteum]KAJ5726272.1 hypothetical protein N7483_007629 [Penicillium malachiteum]